MKVLIVGSGGREHAIAWKVAQSPKVDKIYCAPGNAGIAEYAECVDIAAMEFDKLVAFAKEKEIGLTVIGMDDRWSAVLSMRLRQRDCAYSDQERMRQSWKDRKRSPKTDEKIPYPDGGIRDILRSRSGREISRDCKIPDRAESRRFWLLEKGVLICNTLEEAKEGVKTIMLDKEIRQCRKRDGHRGVYDGA